MKKNRFRKTIAATLCLSTLFSLSGTTALASQVDIQPDATSVEAPTPRRIIIDGNFRFDGQLMVRPSYNSYQGNVIIHHSNTIGMYINGNYYAGSTASIYLAGYGILDTNSCVTFNIDAVLPSENSEYYSRTFGVYELMIGDY